jgi:pSer/pThr/pTyr-binding forkhead associated (FHA) protein
MTNDRLLLWIDGVGGYLVCLGNPVTLGRAQPGIRVDVPILADISRSHAELLRDSEGYLLRAHRPVRVNDQSVERGLLGDGDQITLGTTCKLRFRLPVPLSNTARLEITSGHRLAVTVDGILLMGDTLMLGPGAQSHVQVPEQKQQVVLCRSKDGVSVRYAGEFRVGKQSHRNRTDLTLPATVCAEDAVFTLERAPD